MKSATVATVGAAACLAACAASLAVPALIGAGVLGAGGITAWLSGEGLEWIALVSLVTALGGAVFWYRQRQRRSACAVDGSCGCKPEDNKLT